MKINLNFLYKFLRGGNPSDLANALPGEAIAPIMDTLAQRAEGQAWLVDKMAQPQEPPKDVSANA